MGISKQEMSGNSFDEDLKKPGPKAVKFSTKNLLFVAFAIIILQVADAGIQYLAGDSTSQQGTFMYAAVVFIISKSIYTKYMLKDAKPKDNDALNENEASEEAEEVEHLATPVKDTMNYARTFPARTFRSATSPPTPKSDTPTGKNPNWVPAWLKMDLPKRLNAKAKKFVPLGEWSTLNSDAPLFLPTAQQVEEYHLLKSEFEGETGAVVYRSRHWLQEIRSDTIKEVNPSQPKSKSPERYKKGTLPAQKVQKGSKSPEPARKRIWQVKVNPKDIKWASAWSTFQTACTL